LKVVKAFVPVRMRLVTPISPFFDGSQDWVIVDNDEVTDSSPASGSSCRGSSAVECVIPSSFFIRRFSISTSQPG